jgi:hypothetical protein
MYGEEPLDRFCAWASLLTLGAAKAHGYSYTAIITKETVGTHKKLHCRYV